MAFLDVLKGIGKALEVAGGVAEGWAGAQHGLVRSQCVGWAEGELGQSQSDLQRILIPHTGDYSFLLVSPNWTEFELIVSDGSNVWQATQSQKVEMVRIVGLSLKIARPGPFEMQITARRGFGKYTVAVKPD